MARPARDNPSPVEGPPDSERRGQRTPVGLVVRLAYGSVEEFAQRFAVNLSRGGVFIRTREPKPVGTPSPSSSGSPPARRS
jgi:molecular chaperone DnaK